MSFFYPPPVFQFTLFCAALNLYECFFHCVFFLLFIRSSFTVVIVIHFFRFIVASCDDSSSYELNIMLKMHILHEAIPNTQATMHTHASKATFAHTQTHTQIQASPYSGTTHTLLNFSADALSQLAAQNK